MDTRFRRMPHRKHRLDRFLGRAPKVPFEPVRLFRWRCYRDYGTGVAGDLFVHLFSACISSLERSTQSRLRHRRLRYWKDGRDVPDVFLGLYDTRLSIWRCGSTS